MSEAASPCSPPSSTGRPYDVVLFGATGFTGRLTAAYLAEHAPAGSRWALAGRSKEKLESVRAELAETFPGRGVADLPLLIADSGDAASLREVAESTRVVITTVGPYLLYGEPLVAACAAAGTDYVDLTGEPEFVDRMYVAHHQRAVETGARIVHACGFDSIPYDLGVLYTVQQLPSDVPIHVKGVIRAGGTPSGGTFHSALTQMSRARQMKEAAKARRAVEPRPEGRRSKPARGKPTRDSELGLFLLPLPTIDPVIVARSGAALASYGPDFRYSHFAGVKTLPMAIGGGAFVTGVALAAQVGPVRKLLMSRIQPGEGPSPEKRAKSWFRLDLLAEAGDQRLHTRVSGGDPGYGETAKMLAESALCLAFDDLPKTAGQVTSAQAMGQALIDRLVAGGIAFETLDR